MRILKARCIFTIYMLFTILLQLISNYVSLGNLSQVVFSQHNSDFTLTVYSNGKVVYDNYMHHTTFDIRNCVKYFPFKRYGITKKDFAVLNAETILMLYGDNLIENHRNEAAEKKSAFSINETPPGMNEDIGTFEEIIPNANALIPENSYIQSEFSELIRDSIKKLPKKQQVVIVKMFFEGKSGIEIANELGIDASSVSERKKCAIKNLQKMSDLKEFWNSMK